MTSQELPKKEAALFKSILKMYEFKQYKKGLKSADQILKKVANHGETMVVKALFLSHLGRKEEGFELAKKGLEINPNSGTSWNVLGIMYRNDRNYEEAVKAFVEAVKFDKNNFQIIRDICYLHAHLRNYEAFNDYSQFILNNRPANRAFWAGLAVSYHLISNYDSAIKVLDCYIETFYESNNQPDFEHSELLLYRNLLLQESNQYDKALLDLITIEKDVFDKLSWWGYKANILKQLGKVLEASEAYRHLIKVNPDCKEYIEALLDIEGLNKENLNEEEVLRVLTILDDLKRDNPKSNLLKYLPLVYSNINQFENYAKPYIQFAINKGIPSLFSNLKDLYKNKDKMECIVKIVEEIYHNKDTLINGNGTNHQDASLWALYFLAQHYDKVQDYDKALELIELAIQKQSDMVELYMTKARIYKHLKQLDIAVQVMDQARNIDLADRYVNTKCTKYLLRNDKVEQAENTITMFIRPDSTDRLTELAENQCLWFEIEAAKSRFRQKQYGLALKKAHLITKHFADFEDDQFDFHGYCMRKSTVRPYIKTLVFEDKLYSNKTYIQAVELAAKCYILISEDSEAARNADNPEYAKLSSAEKKKLRIKQKKQLAKATQDSDKNVDLAAKKDKVKKDEDPTGQKYFDIKDPLEEAFKLIKPTLHFNNLSLSFYQIAADVLLRQNKLTLSLKLLLKAIKLDSQSNVNSELLTKFVGVYSTLNSKKELLEPLRKAIDSQLNEISKNYPNYTDTVVGLNNLKV